MRQENVVALLQGDTLAKRMAGYENSASVNEALVAEFAQRTNTIPSLKAHRDWVESNLWGFGDRGFHYLWLLILQHLGAASSAEPLSALEVGVYKGQVISLWALCAHRLGVDLKITAISPFAGTIARTRFIRILKRLFQPSYRKMIANHNMYHQDDYLAACQTIFKQFGLPFEKVRTLRGSSADPKIYAQAKDLLFDLVYIDGDHSFEGSRTDIVQYGPLIKPGGFLVMDDASCELPGQGFFKGHASVSKAARIIPSLGFKNVLNVGHNRVYLRL